MTNKLKTYSNYIKDPLALFYDLTKDNKNNILFESSEIDTKAGTKSMLGIRSALRITSLDNIVTIKVLNNNGQAVVNNLLEVIREDQNTEIIKEEDLVLIKYTKIDTKLDEDIRLKSITTLDTLRKILKTTPIHGSFEDVMLAGVFGYDLVAQFEELPEVKMGTNTCPDYCFYLLDTIINIDHKSKNSQIKCISYTNEATDSLLNTINELKNKLDNYIEVEKPKEISIHGEKMDVNVSDKKFTKIVNSLIENIYKGDIFQAVPSRTFSIKCPSPINAYHTLKQTNPSPYMFYMNDEDFIIFGASPESSIKYTNSIREVEMYPIAGTRKRIFKENGQIDYDLDTRIELDLKKDEKENAEHLMLVDLARNDIAKISEAGTRHVKKLLNVDRYSHVMHLVSNVCGTLRKDLDAIHAYTACMNMGTLTGAPKIKATELIRNIEQERRGSYGGAIGYLTGNGDMDTCIVIRSAFVKNGVAHVQAGCGVVYDSQPLEEVEETLSKAKAVLNAIAISHHTTLEEIM